MMEEAIEHSGNGCAVTEEFSPVLHRTIRCYQGAGALVAAHDDFQEIFGCRGREFAHAEIVDDQQRHSGQ